MTAVDNPPRDPGLVVKRKPGRPRKYPDETDEQRRARAVQQVREWRTKNPDKVRASTKNWRLNNPDVWRAISRKQKARGRATLARLKRIAAARGMTPEELLDGMERG